MSVFGNIVNSAKKAIKGNNSSPNQLVEERFIRQPGFTGVSNNNSLVDDYYQDEDHDGIDDRFEPKKKHGPKDISGVSHNSNPKDFKPFSFKQKLKNYNLSYDKKGKYVPTATYPLPPIRHEKILLDRNKKMRNKDNKFF